MKEKLKAAIRELELPLLVFPILVTCIVAFGFICKYPCSLYEWWIAVSLTIGLIWFRVKDKQVAVISVALLSAFVGVVWIASNVLVPSSGWGDALTYHHPAIRMLAAGWNPVYEGTPECMTAAMGIESNMIHVWHVLSMPKGVWYFCAAAYQFTGSHFNLTFPLSAFLMCSLLYVVWGSFRQLGRCLRGIMCLVAVILVPSTYGGIVDHTIAISGMGLLISMFNQLKTKRCEYAHLIAFTFWMSVSKQTALLHCAVFWFVYFVVLFLIKRQKDIFPCFGAGTAALLLFCMVSVSPYATSLAYYGNPFYPRFSGDENRFPTHNMTADFFDRNDDASEMSHLGAYVNAFISPSLARQYYRQKTGRKCFCPKSRTWNQLSPRSVGAPTHFGYRILFCLSLIALIAFGGVGGRFIAACLVTGTLAMPTEMIGYVRYTPWALSGCLFCLSLISFLKRRILKRLSFLVVAAIIMGKIIVEYPMRIAMEVDRASALMTSLINDPPKELISLQYSEQVMLTSMSGNLCLLCRRIPPLSHARIVTNPNELSYELGLYQPHYSDSFCVSPSYDLSAHSEFCKIQKLTDRKRRLLSYPMFIVRTFFITLPTRILEVVYA